MADRHAGEPIVFFSYARADDQNSNGAASALRADLESALRMVMGCEVIIFQDRDNIAWGQAWKPRIGTALARAKALITLVSPSFLASERCRSEVQAFLDVERQLGREDLVLPLLWVKRPVEQQPRHVRDLAGLLESRQYIDWSRLRFENRLSSQVQLAVHELANRLADLLPIDPADVGSVASAISVAPHHTEEKRTRANDVYDLTDRRVNDARPAGELVDSTSASGGLVVMVVDDEAPALEELAYLLTEDPRVAVVLKASDATDALRLLNGRQGVREAATAGQAVGGRALNPMTGMRVAERSDIEVVFLDIRMPGLDGLELARVFSLMAVPPSVVFYTAHDDRAVDAYEVGAVDYLLKPLRSERLAASLDRIIASRAAATAEPMRDDANENDFISVELAGTTKLVPRWAVRYVEAQGDYARLHTHEGSHLVRIPLRVLEDRWREVGFFRIHRSFLVSLPLVTELRPSGSGCVVRIGSGPDCAELPVSRRHTHELKDRLGLALKPVGFQNPTAADDQRFQARVRTR